MIPPRSHDLYSGGKTPESRCLYAGMNGLALTRILLELSLLHLELYSPCS